MEILNDDVLIKIFSYLTIEELLRIQYVCKKWKGLVRFAPIRHLDIRKFERVDGVSIYDNICTLLECHGSSLHTIILSDNYNINNKMLFIIGDYCKNIRKIIIAKSFMPSSTPTYKRKRKLHNITGSWFNKRGISYIFENCKYLQQFDFGKYVNDQWFDCANSTIKIIHIDNYSNKLTDKTLKFIKNNYPNLYELDLKHPNQMMIDGLKHLTNLKSLRLIMVGWSDDHGNSKFSLVDMTELESLVLIVKDHFHNEILRRLPHKLQKLYIDTPDQFVDERFNHYSIAILLEVCPYLTTIGFTTHVGINDGMLFDMLWFKYLTTLQINVFDMDGTITSNGLADFIERSRVLRCIEVRNNMRAFNIALFIHNVQLLINAFNKSKINNLTIICYSKYHCEKCIDCLKSITFPNGFQFIVRQLAFN